MAVTRITGISSGMDTDQLVKDLMKIEKAKVDNVKRDRTRLEWKQDQYREMTTLMTGFKSSYFDVLNSDTNLASKTMFSEFTTSTQSNGVDTDAVTVEGTSSTLTLDHTITSISQLARIDKYESSDVGLTEIKTDDFVLASMPDDFKINLTIDGKTKTIDFTKASMDTQDIDGFIDALQDEIEDEFGADYRDVVSKDGAKVSFKKAGTQVTVLNYTDSESSLTFLGLESGESSTSYQSKSIGDLLGVVEGDLANMKIGDNSFVDLGLSVDSTIDEVTKAINNNLGAIFSYNELSDEFEIRSTKVGTVNELDLSDGFKSAFKFDTGTHTEAKNAVLEINGETIVKSSNSFIVSGIKLTLNKTHTEPDPIDIKITRDTDKVYDKIKTFVAEYNKIIEIVNLKLDEKVNRDYDPLTDEEKADLSDDNVKLWEDKAKSGTLKNDDALTKMLSDMRTALYDSVEGTGLSLYNIGITTSKNYKENGKLVINEIKLKESLDNDYESVVNLFSSKSDNDYYDQDTKSERYRENGIGNRLLDIINDNIRLTRDKNGIKGTLIEKAGLPGDSSTTSNDIARNLKKYDDRILDLLKDLASTEERHYAQFGAMEAALSRLQSQSSSLMSQLG